MTKRNRKPRPPRPSKPGRKAKTAIGAFDNYLALKRRVRDEVNASLARATASPTGSELAISHSVRKHRLMDVTNDNE
jgi:hypothetical protein